MKIKVIIFGSKAECEAFISSMDQRLSLAPFTMCFPMPTRDGRWYAGLIPGADSVLTEAERAAVVELSESDLPDPPPMP